MEEDVDESVLYGSDARGEVDEAAPHPASKTDNPIPCNNRVIRMSSPFNETIMVAPDTNFSVSIGVRDLFGVLVHEIRARRLDHDRFAKET